MPAVPLTPLTLAPLPRNRHRPRTRSVATPRSHLDCRNVLILIVAGQEGLSTVQDLLGKVLAGGVNHLFRRGIDRGYVERREDLAGIRGKLAVSATAKRALRARGRAACDFEELSVDILPNQILRTSLRGLRDRRIRLDKDVRGDVRSAYRRLDGVSRTHLKRNTFGQVQLGGNRRLYQFLLSVCRLLYESSVVDENTGRTAFRDFRRDEATMWALFEEFVTRFYEREQSVYRVNPGGRRVEWADKGWATEEDRTRIPVMEADVILDSPERRIILDTKYYQGRAGERARFRHQQASLRQPLPASRVPAEPPGHPAGRSEVRRHSAVPAGRRAAEGRHPPRGLPHPGADGGPRPGLAGHSQGDAGDDRPRRDVTWQDLGTWRQQSQPQFP